MGARREFECMFNYTRNCVILAEVLSSIDVGADGEGIENDAFSTKLDTYDSVRFAIVSKSVQ